MVTYYEGQQALVTDRVFAAWSPGYQRFAIADLTDVWIVRGGADPFAVGSTCMGGGALVVAAAGWPLFDMQTTWLAVFAAAAVPMIAGAVRWRRAPRPYELWAWYRGHQVRLFSCSDRMVFGQVSRALQRSLERDQGR
jgi:hypothetical protein